MALPPVCGWSGLLADPRADCPGQSVFGQRVLSYVDREVHLRHGGVKNFSGLVRVICVAWLQDAPDTR
jgi:hypothetical protein